MRAPSHKVWPTLAEIGEEWQSFANLQISKGRRAKFGQSLCFGRGAVSAEVLRKVCRLVLLGHSEQKQNFSKHCSPKLPKVSMALHSKLAKIQAKLNDEVLQRDPCQLQCNIHQDFPHIHKVPAKVLPLPEFR